jgi:pimeloyl-ACP methyl ester carboxylesterase
MDDRQQPVRQSRILNSAERRDRVIPLSFQLAGVALNLVSRLHNEWASDVLARLWFTVFKSRPKPWVADFWASADACFELPVYDVSIPIYVWGEGPLVVLMHGWSGSGTQYRYFIPVLVEAGFRVACFDAPEHGNNPGRRTHMLRFSASLLGIQERLGSVDCVIAHSLGGMAATFALQQGLAPARLVLVAPHLEVQKMFETFRDLLSMRPALARRFHDKIGDGMAALRDGMDPWRELVPARLLDQPDLSGLLVFDYEDPEITPAQFEEMSRLWRGAEVHSTRGLGHNRILKDRAVIDAITAYLAA